ncbi:MAG: undecaprenyl-diphosphate phosphatase [Epsilonproteobacteria bacterium]|nr:undecaprenyl-diphosphate phosphatase [Campylobacterota bacterium]
MDIFQAIILGIVEGLTEFLPISSTGHMIVVANWMGMDENAENKAFMVIIQLAAILAVVLNYRDKFTLQKVDLWIKVLIGFLPLAIVGFLFKDVIKESFTAEVVAYMFIVGGIIFLIVEYFYKEENHHTLEVEDITYKQAGWIGFAQMFALIPGTSRAGSTIVGALLVGLSRRASAEFSFLLAIPVMLATSGYDLLKHYDEFTQEGILTLGIGFIVSFVVAYLTMMFFIKFLEKFTFVAFGVYRILFGLLLLAFYL